MKNDFLDLMQRMASYIVNASLETEVLVICNELDFTLNILLGELDGYGAHATNESKAQKATSASFAPPYKITICHVDNEHLKDGGGCMYDDALNMLGDGVIFMPIFLNSEKHLEEFGQLLED